MTRQAAHLQNLAAEAERLTASGQWAEATKCWHGVARAEPEHPVPWYNLGLCAHRQKNLAEALTHYRRALKTAPDLLPAMVNAGDVLMELHRPEEAGQIFAQAAQTHPHSAEAWAGLGLVNVHLNRLPQAVENLRKAREISPQNITVLSNLATALWAEGKVQEAEELYRQAAEREDREAAYSLGMLLLLQGKWDEATAWMEKRIGLPACPKRPLEIPLWKGENLRGKKIFIGLEQGPGDVLMWASLLPALLKQEPETVYLEAEPRMAKLLERSFPTIRVVHYDPAVASQARAASLDFHCPLGTLQAYVNPEKDYPLREGYLKADPSRAALLRKRYEALGKKRLCGISWLSKGTMTSRARSAELREWLPILQAPDTLFVSLQYGDCEKEIRALKKETGIEIIFDKEVDALTDMDGFAAQVAAMDRVISCANSTVHMAGGLGIPTYVLVPRIPSWRWGLQGEESHWYGPPVKLFRQSGEGWDEVIGKIVDQI